ncbi:MAG: cobyrinate a,c-diamide synthase [Dehalococcoidia bacterium]
MTDAGRTIPRPGIVVAGATSGAGKTTLATGLMAALAARGLRVQPFKVGPDYIDPSYHTAVCGRSSRTLDGWMVGQAATVELYHRAVGDADVAVVEGVMGLYDGRSGGGEEGSTAQVAKLLGLPVLLVIDAGKSARSVGATAAGFRAFDRDVRIGGVILNNVASERHAEVVRDAVEREAGIPVFGTLPRDEGLRLPERYLGLIPVTEGTTPEAYFNRARELVARHVDLDRVFALAATADPPEPVAPALFPATPQPIRARIAVAMDRAFSFYYPDSLDLLRAWGAEIVPFSPLDDPTLPDGCDAVYIGGGFPELFAVQLASNSPMRDSLHRAAADDRLIYGECGGLMYLGESLTDAEGRTHRMTGLLPVNSTMSRSRLTLAYWDLVTRDAGPFVASGHHLRGHEFHWSVADRSPSEDEAMYELEGVGRLEGFRRGSVHGSYVHLHLASDPALAPGLIHAALHAEVRRDRLV